MKTIVTIGGGDMRKGTLLAIDQEIVRLSRKTNPKFLFIPTASSDDQRYCEIITKYYQELNCQTEVLKLVTEKPSTAEIAQKIQSADIIYVGGGNTLKMMRLWRKLGVDLLLKAAWNNGTVMCGVSAGSICWFESGHSDSMSYYNPDKWQYIQVTGLGFLQGVHCPHFDSETLGVARKDNFAKMIGKLSPQKTGIAIDDHCAMVWQDGQYRVITTTTAANAYRVYRQNGQVICEALPKNGPLLPVKELYK
jgi:dipeptidase E